MNTTTRRPLAALALGLSLALPALAQVAPVETPREAASPRDRIERITHEDKLTRIEEVRVGGQTQSIDELFRSLDRISANARETRLKVDKLVKARGQMPCIRSMLVN